MQRPFVTPFEQNQFLEHVQRNLDVDRDQEILFAGAKIGRLDFLPLYRSCMERTGTAVPGWKTFRRAQRALVLARYFDHALSVAGGRAECGVYKGFSSLMLCLVARMREADFDGTGYHLVDSFDGLSTPTDADAIDVGRLPTGETRTVYSHPAGFMFTPIDHVQSVMAEFPGASIHKGWIPDVFADLPEIDWAFVHIDVDLFEPTQACLEYFLPRLAPGGVIVNDDFDSPLFPGGGRSWKAVMEKRGLSYAVLDTGQAVFVNRPAT